MAVRSPRRGLAGDARGARRRGRHLRLGTLAPAPSAAHAARAADAGGSGSCREIARERPEVEGLIALLGDKQLLFAEDGDGFVSYAVRRTSWVAMGDPVGPPDVISELAWRLRELADMHGGRVAFYQTCAATLPVYIDMGLTPFKLGDEAVVPLREFSLEGSRRKTLRQSHTRAERDGLTFELIPRADVPANMPLLEAISREWLGAKNTREKRFSLGAFVPDYVCRNDVALVRCKGLPVAFATLMTTARSVEASVDLMRHTGAAPGSTMEFLFVKLLLHFKALGYERFMLGMAPLSGLENHPLAPVWHRFGHLIYNRGERFYNFQGLRLFKDKFEPRCEPRYLVTHSGLNPLIVMVDVAALIAGGVGGVFSK
ncbi:MAG: bifunctional lysylphosphatidylglycerol flippase/synthetase MprF [Gammaproteobacteria bacterium]|nr:bifunctional lysylphosphatidylglycerol flippase/synthetase MprF [Gammaproteobacteria bacterium]